MRNFEFSIHPAHGKIRDEITKVEIAAYQIVLERDTRVLSILINNSKYQTLLKKFPTLTSQRRKEAPMRNDIERHIPTTGRPAYCKLRRMHPNQKREAKMAFDHMEREGIVTLLIC